MEFISRTISSLIENEYKNYSRYVCYNRAIPNLIDSFKPSQRKAFYVIPKTSDFIKVQAVSGRMISEANYNHGDASASETVTKMAQDFTGSNNIPVFEKKGSFGSKFIKKGSAPRYIYVKANKLFYDLYNDFELCPLSDDIENPEPKYYLPIIPTILLNGVSGIAVGFATEILPYNIFDIIGNIKNFLNQTAFDEMVPFFNGFNGEVYKNSDGTKYIQCGKYEILNTNTIKVKEVPTEFDREKYIKHLDNLVEKKIITTYDENCKGSDWNITIKAPRSSKIFDDVNSTLKLESILNENITVIDEHGEIITFLNAYDLLTYFIKFRLGVYQQRIQYMLNKIKEEVFLNRSKIKFILEMNQLDFKNLSKGKIREHFKNLEFSDDHLNKCFDIKSYNFNIDFLKELKNRIEELKKEWEYYKIITPKELYLIDLNNLEKKLK